MIAKCVSLFVAAYLAVAGFNYATTSPEDSSVLIQAVQGRANGSGVLIGDNLVLTARHVTEATRITPLKVTLDGHDFPCKVVAEDDMVDLGLLFCPGVKGPKAYVGNVAKVGDNVTATGYPLYNMLTSRITTSGVILKSDPVKYLMTTQLLPGNSGGGLYKLKWYGRWELVGINVAGMMLPIGFTASFLDNYTVAVNSDFIKRFLSNNGY